jgi:hypothetical protein
MNIVNWEGKPSNILLRLANNKECDYACVFVHPDAVNKSRTYEMLALLSEAPPGFPPKSKHGIYRYYSNDGMHW